MEEVRDPFIFVHEGRRYAIQGAGHPLKAARVLLYGCDDLKRWTELGTLLTTDDPMAAEVAAANIWECPNLVQIDGQWIAVFRLGQDYCAIDNNCPHASAPLCDGTVQDGPGVASVG